MSSRTGQKIKNSLGRAFFAALSILLQIGWIFVLLLGLNRMFAVLSWAATGLALVMALRIFGRHDNAAVKLSWIIVILAVPIFGVCLYVMFGWSGATWRMRRHFALVEKHVLASLPDGDEAHAELEARSRPVANQSRYIRSYSRYPVYRGTKAEYHAQASDGLEAIKKALSGARKFIFMEYHAIEYSTAFFDIEKILFEKAASGVEVRLFYDDMGSIGFISRRFVRRMEEHGVSCRVFNPLVPLLNVFMNNRDHRKITVVDGEVGFTGGYNLADEYFNYTSPYGHWKDTGLKLTGDAVKSLTIMFLQMWNAQKSSDTSFERYLDVPVCRPCEDCFVQPFADSPLDDERVGENVYLNMIKSAEQYVYIMTPYLIIDDEMNLELCLAAKRGVDVRIITPGIPDKKLVYRVTRSYYASLAQSGVRIFEYTPGFMHAKVMLCDGITATVGTINLDYRSLYLHFEDGVFLYGCSAINDIRADFDATLPLCCEVTEKYGGKRSAALRFGQCALRLFAPLL